MKFTTPVSMVANIEQRKKLSLKLRELGYITRDITACDPDPKIIIATRFAGDSNTAVDLSFGQRFIQNRNVIESYSEDLFLALAAMNDNPKGIKGEWWFCTNGSSGEFVTGKLYQQQKNRISSSHCFIDEQEEANGFSENNQKYFRKATKEEIINHFILQTVLVSKQETKSNNITKTNMKQTISRKDFGKIHAVACADWKVKLTGWAEGSSLFSDTIDLSDDQVGEMFKAATESQVPVLEKYLKKPTPSHKFKVGDWVKIINNSQSGHTLGSIGEIYSMGPEAASIKNAPNSPDDGIIMSSHSFENLVLATQTEVRQALGKRFKRGDIVVITANTNNSSNKVGDIGAIGKEWDLDHTSAQVFVPGKSDISVYSKYDEIRPAMAEEKSQYEVKANPIKEGDIVVITKRGCGTSDDDVNRICKVVNIDSSGRRYNQIFNKYTTEVDYKKGNNNGWLNPDCLRKATESEKEIYKNQPPFEVGDYVLNDEYKSFFGKVTEINVSYKRFFYTGTNVSGDKRAKDFYGYEGESFRRASAKEVKKRTCQAETLVLGSERLSITIEQGKISCDGRDWNVADLKKTFSFFSDYKAPGYHGMNTRFIGDFRVGCCTFSSADLELIISTAESQLA